MFVKKFKDYEKISEVAANSVIELIRNKPNCVLGLATGSSPVRMYQLLIEAYKRGEVDFSGVKTFNLDEYLGLTEGHPQSYLQFMKENLFNHVNIKSQNINMPQTNQIDIKESCIDYEREILLAGGIDLQILGIGINGHIGFNEPGTSFSTRTHIIKLHEDTRVANARFFDTLDDVPKEAITMGIKTIMQAKRIILLASGQSKQEAMYNLVFSEINENFPASVLKLHPNVEALVDEMAVFKLKMPGNMLFC